jgi:TonB-linked SusC/RagA family outer membrane protein
MRVFYLKKTHCLILNRDLIKFKLIIKTLILFTLITVPGITPSLYSQTENAQSAAVTGTVLSNNNEPLPGVNIVEKGTTNGTITDIDGKYTLTLETENPVLVFSFLGFITKEIEVGAQTQINITLEEDLTELEEVVVVGYGTVKKTDLTGAVGTMDEEMLTERSVNNPMEALQGSVAGVTVSSSPGRLGDAFTINIRGNNSLENDARENDGDGTTIGGVSQPLYIIDGVASDGIDFLNPHDIARMDILKDASSTAIYGSRGSNGVVIITTKSGATAKKGVNVSFDSYYGIKKAVRIPDFMDGQEWWHFHQTAYTDGDIMNMTQGAFDSAVYNISAAYPAPYGQNARLAENAQGNITTDWVDLVTQDGMMANNYLSIMGAGESVSYNIGVGVQNETGLIQKEALDRALEKADDLLKNGV